MMIHREAVILLQLSGGVVSYEGISLATTKLGGIGMIGHKISFSLGVILWTVCGFVTVQFLSTFCRSCTTTALLLTGQSHCTLH
jgi:hypothetical protein